MPKSKRGRSQSAERTEKARRYREELIKRIREPGMANAMLYDLPEKFRPMFKQIVGLDNKILNLEKHGGSKTELGILIATKNKFLTELTSTREVRMLLDIPMYVRRHTRTQSGRTGSISPRSYTPGGRPSKGFIRSPSELRKMSEIDQYMNIMQKMKTDKHFGKFMKDTYKMSSADLQAWIRKHPDMRERRVMLQDITDKIQHQARKLELEKAKLEKKAASAKSEVDAAALRKQAAELAPKTKALEELSERAKGEQEKAKDEQEFAKHLRGQAQERIHELHGEQQIIQDLHRAFGDEQNFLRQRLEADRGDVEEMRKHLKESQERLQRWHERAMEQLRGDDRALAVARDEFLEAKKNLK
jgi:hypothetical protein